MKISKIKIHNFRSVRDAEIDMQDYSLMVGANNTGKTNVIDALRIFYEYELKFNPDMDFPRFQTDDQESWIEIAYRLSDEEYKNLKDEYKQLNNTFKVRKYLKSSNLNRVKPNQSNIYAYEKEKLSNNLYYGAKNISQAKLGSVVYIPAISSAEEQTKLSGPSTFRNLLDFVMKKVIKKSKAYENLQDSFSLFNQEFQKESFDGVSIEQLKKDINSEISAWGTTIGIDINPIDSSLIIKGLLTHYLNENNLGKEKMSLTSFGQGFQRHLIFTLLKLSNKYKDKEIKTEKKEFLPDFTLILFDEPEAFLHPAQQEILNLNLEELGRDDDQQVLISTHSPCFVSKNVDEVNSLIKFEKNGAETGIHQIDKETLKGILEGNCKLKEKLGQVVDKVDFNRESVRYSCWLDSARASSFFADFVLICEGATDKVLIDYLIKNKRIKLNKEIYVLDALGKYNIHRYISLFSKLGIKHSVLYDSDQDKGVNKIVNEHIKESKTSFTKDIFYFDTDIEDFLNIPKPDKSYDKPINMLWHFKSDKIEEKKLNELSDMIEKLVN